MSHRTVSLTCVQCRTTFDGSSKRTKYCSKYCRSWAAFLGPGKTKHCMVCGRRMMASRSSKPGDGKCQECARHGLGGYARGCRCSICSETKAQAMKDYWAKKVAQDGVLPSTAYRRSARGVDPDVDLSCGKCGEPVGSYRGKATPYHRDCRPPKWLLEGRQGPAQQRARALLKRAAEGTNGGGRVWTVGNCPWCGEFFTSPNAKFCSRRCRTYERESRNPFKFVISPLTRNEIYERDKWICQLCFEPVDPELNYLDNWAASLDHIIPQSVMLVPDHSPENLQLAHRVCNSMKGNRVELEVV